MNVLDLALQRVKLRKVATTNGGEWQGPCPACGGEDRFHVWPQQQDGKGGYWCRGCDRTGDNIQFLRDFDGLSFKEACMQLNMDMPDIRGHGEAIKKQRPPQDNTAFQPNHHTPPADLWREKAEKFVAWSRDALAKNAEIIARMAERGISAEAAATFRLGWNAGENGKDIYRARKAWGLEEVLKDDGKPKALWIPRGLVIPHLVNGVVHRVRIRRPEGEPRYYVLPGSSMGTMIIGADRRAFVIVESELDAMAVAMAQDMAGSMAMGSVSAKPDAESFTVLQGSLQILNALDYDAAGSHAMAWWTEQFSQCERWPVPKGKDPGDARRMGIDLDSWIKAGLPPALTIKTGRVTPPVKKESETVIKSVPKEKVNSAPQPDASSRPDLPSGIWELYDLLRNNPGTRIINTPDRFTVLRNDRFVGGRINELVFRTPAITDYLINHPAEQIDGGNLIV